MKKILGPNSYVFPMPVLLISTYCDDGTPNVMNAAWGGIFDTNKIGICISSEHKTFENISKRKAYTVSFADAKHITEADYVGIVSANDVKDKFANTGFTVTKSQSVDAPVINELPVCLECRFLSYDDESGYMVGEIVNVLADDSVLEENGSVNIDKLQPICFEPSAHGYHIMGKKVGNAFEDGNKLVKK